MNLLDNNKENIFGRRLKNLRYEIMRKTQKEFSELLGIPQPTLSAYESGRNKPTIDVVIRIADTCNVSVDWLCGRDHISHIDSLADVMNFFFELYEAKEFSCATKIYDRVDLEDENETNDAKRNWIRLMFYHNEVWHNPENVYSQEICGIIRRAYEMHSRLVNFDYPQDYYESEKRRLIDTYSNYPVTKIDFSDIPEDERIRLRNEKMIAEWEMQKAQSDET